MYPGSARHYRDTWPYTRGLTESVIVLRISRDHQSTRRPGIPGIHMISGMRMESVQRMSSLKGLGIHQSSCRGT
eukprot:1349563-Amorphochlora_amoeboformis.AAC.2